MVPSRESISPPPQINSLDGLLLIVIVIVIIIMIMIMIIIIIIIIIIITSSRICRGHAYPSH